MAFKLTDLEIDRVDAVDKGANPGAFITLFKRDTPMAEDVKPELGEIEKRLADAEAKVQEATDKLAEAKNVSKAAAEKIATLETQNREITEKAERSEFVSKAAEFSHIAKADDFAPVLRKIHKTLDEKEREWLYKWLASLNAVAKSSALFTELGVGGSDQSGSAYDKLEKMAVEIRKAEPALTPEQAFAKAAKSDAGKALYSEYLKEGK